MKSKVHQPGTPVKTVKKPKAPKAKIHKFHKDWFGADPVDKEITR